MDTEEAVKEFEEALSSFDISGMAQEMGVPADMVEVGGVPCNLYKGVERVVLYPSGVAMLLGASSVVVVGFFDCFGRCVFFRVVSRRASGCRGSAKWSPLDCTGHAWGSTGVPERANSANFQVTQLDLSAHSFPRLLPFDLFAGRYYACVLFFLSPAFFFFLYDDDDGADDGQSLGLSEFSEVLANPPPGIDELVALSRVLKLARSEE